MGQVVIQVHLEGGGFRADCAELPGFHLADGDFQSLLAQLPMALESHCGEAVSHRVRVHTNSHLWAGASAPD